MIKSLSYVVRARKMTKTFAILNCYKIYVSKRISSICVYEGNVLKTI